ncbi:MAG: CoA-binding protein [Bacteroidota bacterium]
MIRKAQIDEFLKSQNIAVVGVSRNPKKFGYMIYKALLDKGYNCYPINPNMESLEGKTCYKDLFSLNEPVDACVIITGKASTDSILKQAVEKGLTNIWIQQTSETPYVKEFAKSSPMNIIYGKCMLMFLEPVSGMHGFHRFLMKLFGRLPK